MNEQLETLILDWSDKLGVGIEFIWTAMIKQAFVGVCIDISIIIPILIVSTLLAIKMRKRKLALDNTEKTSLNNLNSLLLAMLMGLLCFIVILFSHCIISGLLNPEYIALELLFR